MIRQTLVSLLLLCLLPGLAAGDDKKKKADKGELFEGIVAVVGNRVVTRYDLRLAMMPHLVRIPTDLPKKKQEVMFQRIQQEVLRNVVDNELVLVAAERMGIEVDEDEVTEQMARVLSGAGLDPGKPDQSARTIGYDSAAHFREHLREKILRDRVVMMQVRSKVKITDRELEIEFKKRYPKKSYRAVKIAHVLFKLNPNANLDNYRKVFTRAVALFKDLRAGKLTFEEAARKHSEDRLSAEDDGVIGFVTEGTLEADFERAIYSLKVGEYSEPVRTRLGIHIVKVVGEEMRTFDSASQEEEFRLRLRALLEEDLFKSAFERWLLSLRQNTKIDIRL